MVASYVQLEPVRPLDEALSPDMDLEDLLWWYGEGFDYEEDYIELSRGGFLASKRKRGWRRDDSPDRLSIQHPVDSDRDLASGSYGVRLVVQHLSQAASRVYEFRDHLGSEVDSVVRGGQGLLAWIGIRLTSELIEQRQRSQVAWVNIRRFSLWLRHHPTPPHLPRAGEVLPPTTRNPHPIIRSHETLKLYQMSATIDSSPRPSLPPPVPSASSSPPSTGSSSSTDAFLVPLLPLRLIPTIAPPEMRTVAQLTEEFRQRVRAVEAYNDLASRRNAELRQARSDVLWTYRKAGVHADPGSEFYEETGAIVRGLFAEANRHRGSQVVSSGSSPPAAAFVQSSSPRQAFLIPESHRSS